MLSEWLSSLPIITIIGMLVGAALVIGVTGTRLSRIADQLADATGMGEAIFGALLLGASTSLAGIVTSVTAASQGYAELAASNAIGGIAAQTMFLALGDLAYRHSNLEHAAASMTNLLQGVLLVTLLSLPLLAASSPAWTLLGVHPISVVLLSSYILGTTITSKARATPMWQPRQTHDTQPDEPEPSDALPTLKHLWWRFGLLTLTIAIAGYIVAETGAQLATRTGLGELVVGSLLTSVITSLPELVTTIAAVRQGALTLAVGGIIGGNSFDMLFLAFADVGYREGSIYHAMGQRPIFLIALTMLLTGILTMGLLRRERTGFANIGLEGVLILGCYALGSWLMFYL